jgi:hypothetical protein
MRWQLIGRLNWASALIYKQMNKGQQCNLSFIKPDLVLYKVS